jgi:hypothetical protein
MNLPRIAVLLLFTLSVFRARAQDNTPPATTPASPEIQKWIESTDATWQAAYQRDVTGVYNTELIKLNLEYLTTLEAAMAKASRANDLDGAVALRNEQNRFSDTKVIPDQDAAADAAPVKEVRAANRAQLARLDGERAARAKALLAKYDQVLAQAQAQLTQRGRLDDALLVKARRKEVTAAWLADIPAPAALQAPGAAATVTSPPAAPPTAGDQLAEGLADSTWRWSVKPNDDASNKILTVRADGTVSWNDRPSLHVPYKVRGKLSIQVGTSIYTFSNDLESLTVRQEGADSVSRWGTRTKMPE